MTKYLDQLEASLWEKIRNLQPTDSSDLANQLTAVRELRKDAARLDWLIKQGPPGANEGIGLTDELWELATAEAGKAGLETDNEAVRSAIDTVING